MSGRPKHAPAGEQDKGDEESLVAPLACAGGASDRHGSQIAAARSNGSHLPDPILVGLVRLLARQAAREAWETLQRKDLITDDDQDQH